MVNSVPVIPTILWLCTAFVVMAHAGNASADVNFTTPTFSEWVATLRDGNFSGSLLAQETVQTSEATTPPAPKGPKDFSIDAEAITVAMFGGLDVFGIWKHKIKGRTDPWMAFRMEFTNQRNADTYFRLDGNFATNDMIGDTDFVAMLDVTVQDTSGDGTASFTDGWGVFEVWHFEEFVFNRVAGDTAPWTPQIVAPGMYNRISATGTTNPADPFGGSLFDELAFFGGGVISPGDTVVFEGFTCIVNSGGTCPEPPDLSEVPLPPALLLFAAAWVGLGAGGRVARWRVYYQRLRCRLH